MQHFRVSTIAIAAVLTAAGAASAQDIVIEDTMARIVWTEADAVSVSVDNPSNATETPDVQERNGRFTVTGDLGRMRNLSCRGEGDDLRVRTSRRGDYRSIGDFPVIEVSAPSDARLIIEDSMILGEVGDLGSGEVEMDGCGELSIGNVSNDLSASVDGSGDIRIGDIGGQGDLEVAGSGDLTAGDVDGGAELEVAGSGNLSTGRINGGASVEVAGSGDVSVGSIDGGLDVDIAGSGDVVVGGGAADPLVVDIAGSGNVELQGDARDPEISIMGSGDVDVERYSGRVKKSIMGSGDFNGECAGECD